MRAFLGFAVLLAGVGAVAMHIGEPRRFKTDMTPLTQNADRLASFSAVVEPASGPATRAEPADETAFKTTVTSYAAADQSDAAEVSADTGVWSETSSLDGATREALARDIQTELARLGCYGGAIDGSWSTEAQRAAGAFTTKANARISVAEPDFALFSLAKTATPDQACGPAITVADAKPVVEPPAAMGLGGPDRHKPPRAKAYHNDRSVQSLFTNPLGR